jgi:mannitol-1-/sugar-/sorbitol-6-phosphatase
MREEIDLGTQRFDIARHFETIVSNEDVANHKPDPEPYLLCAERLGVVPTRCTVFEDSVSGIRAGKAAGMGVIAFTSTFAAEKLIEADVVIDCMADTDAMLRLVESLEAGQV